MNSGIEYFDNIKLDGDRPLYLQIRALIASFIDNSKPDTVFPSERELVTRLKINRRTLRKALLPFVESGQLQRNVCGTVIRKQESAASTTDDEVQSFLLEVAPIFHYQKSVLSIAIYENMPQQVKFWTRSVEAFNRQSYAEARISWLSSKDFKKEDFFDWYKEHHEFDIYLMHPCWNWPNNFETFPLSRSMVEYVGNESFQTSEFCEFCPEFTNKAAVIGIAFPSCVWNLDATAGRIKHLPERFHNGDTNNIFSEAAKKLLPGMHISADYATIMPDIGYPANIKNETIKKLFWQKLERIAIVAKRKKWNLVFQPSEQITFLGGIKSFAAGDCFFVGSLNSMLKMLLAKVPFKYEKTLLLPPEGHYIFSTDINMVIHPKCRNIEAAEEFLRFMLSSPIQRDLAEITGIAPVRREALNALSIGKLPPAEIDNFIRHNKCLSPKFLERFQKKVVLHPYYEQLLHGKMTLEDTFTVACEDFFLKNPKFADGASGQGGI